MTKPAAGLFILIGGCLFLGWPAGGLAQSEPAAQDRQATQKEDATARAKSAGSKSRSRVARSRVRTQKRDPNGFFMGRRIAEVMSWEGADWLVRESRIREEQPELMLDALKLPPGGTVADVGAGVGYHSIRMARRVGPKGTVLATDLQPEMLRMLQENARAAGVKNIKPIRSSQRDPRLPEAAVDLILMVDVYHECTDPESLLAAFKKALKPGGRLVLVEFRGEDPEVPIKPEHKMTLEQVRKEVEPQGLEFQESLEFLPWQHVIIFKKPVPKTPAPKGQDKPAEASPKPASPAVPR